jgi:D-alanyl-D-alanine carboxypeptidase
VSAVRRGRRVALVVAITVAGLVAGGAAGFLAQGQPRPAIPPPEHPEHPEHPERSGTPGNPEHPGRPGGTGDTPAPAKLPDTRPLTPDTLLAWVPGGLPPGFADGVRDAPGVRHAVAVVSGVVWLTGTTEGGVVRRPPSGLAWPVEVAGATLTDYAPFLPPDERPLLADLARGGAVLGETSARVRGIEPGETATLSFGGVDVPVAGVVPDESVGANEVFVSLRTAHRLGLRTERYLLVDPTGPDVRPRIERGIHGLLAPGTPLRTRGPGETPYFRQGDAVLAPVRLKELFGEFAARPVAGGYLDPDPAWEAANIETARVPILGEVRCNRAIFPQLRGALRDVRAQGLSSLIDPAEYGGCYSPRFALRNPRSGLSHHAWGVAIDLNVAANPFGRTPTMDRRIVAIFARWGFTWGGRFLVPDGMHFEFLRYPPGG